MSNRFLGSTVPNAGGSAKPLSLANSGRRVSSTLGLMQDKQQETSFRASNSDTLQNRLEEVLVFELKKDG
jgi:hypothetical protein